MVDLGITQEHYNFMMALSGILFGCIVNLLFILLVHKFS